MKKFLLFALVALVTVSASAVNRFERAPKPREQKTVQALQKQFGGIVANRAVSYQLPDAKSFAQNYQAVKRADGDKLTLTPCYSERTYHYSSVAGGFLIQIMYDKASFLVADGIAYLKPFANLGIVAGVVEKDVENKYSEYEADSITFSVSEIAHYINPETGDTTNLVLEPCNDADGGTLVRAGEKTFGAYYFAEDNELYIPSSVCLALFPEDESVTEIFDEYYVVCALDLQPQEDLNQYISKGTVRAQSYYGESKNYENDVLVFLGYDAFCVKGVDGTNEDAWVMFELDSEDENVATVFENQYLATYQFYTDETRTETQPGEIVTVGLIQSEGTLTGWAEDYDYASLYSITYNEDETTTLANIENTVYGDYVWMANDGGMYNAVDLNVNITYEPADLSAIKGVSNSSKSNGAAYNLAGQRVDASYKGIVVKDGKKMLQK